MSYWGYGIKQSDEFSDVYGQFFELYKGDAKATDVYKAILEEYMTDCADEENFPYLYTVYYALAYCLWECGEKDEALWRKIKDIIDSGADVKFWKDSGSEDSIKKRQKALIEFWERINSVPQKIKKPKRSQNKREPTLHKGDLYAYKCDEGYRVALVLDYVWNSYLTAISEDIFDNVPSQELAMNTYTHTVTWFSQRESIPKKERIKLADIPVTGNYNNRAGLLFSDSVVGCSSIGYRRFFFDLEEANTDMEKNKIGRYKMSDLLDPEVLPKYLPKVDVNKL